MRRPRTYRKNKDLSKKTVIKKALKKNWKKKVSGVVKNVLSRTVEIKKQVASIGIQPQTLQLTTTSVAGNYQIVSPGNSSSINLVQGTSNNQRIGNTVHTKRLTLQYTIYPNAYNVNTNPAMMPQEVIIYFFKIKGNASREFDVVYDLPKLYEAGGNAIAPTGYLMDCLCKLNSDYYQYLTHRRHKVGRAVVGNAANLTAPNYNSATNNDFKWNIVSKIDLTKFCPKKISWSDGSSTSSAPVIHMLVQTVAADGSLASTAILPISIFGRVEYQYTDE